MARSRLTKQYDAAFTEGQKDGRGMCVMYGGEKNSTEVYGG
jgi:hypothetical protein